MFDINGAELVVILLVAAVVIGPHRLPGYAEQLADLVRRGRAWLSETRTRIDAESGDLGVDWEALDPRRYDPRRIVREALLEPDQPVATATAAAGAWPGSRGRTTGSATVESPAPFDDEAT
ncbi:Sec-independent protein translocase TatB [Cellulomonas composti]|uniref:Translocase n=1 Tax=Cellulomonas composti TaxID=266130 RepID=A0A511JD20_9CELL|nr:Sec-independent protein translocase TatB [Cellulomonas composti]GEL95689.1 translocase [Cellulomonas composti]